MAGVQKIYGCASTVRPVRDAPTGIWAYSGGLNRFGHPARKVSRVTVMLAPQIVPSIRIACSVKGDDAFEEDPVL